MDKEGKTKEQLIEEELQRAKEELATQAWGIHKTSEAIKILYKELEKKNNELKNLDQMKSDFVSTVSHELRMPLAIIREGVSQVLDKVQGEVNEKQEKVLATVMKNIDRLTRLVNNLLNISKIEEGRIELKRELVNFIDLIRQVTLSFAPKIEEKGLNLRLNLPQERIEIYADNDRIIQVLTNLLGNALKFTLQGFVEVSVREKENSVECSVSDSGIGISGEDLPKVFTKFQQFGRVNGSGEKGTGLGLSIAKGFIALHKGKIWVESELGKGTKFTFILPKYSWDEFFEERINYRIKEANKSGNKVSLAVFSIVEFARLTQEFPPEKIKAFLKEIENVLTQSLRRKEDVAQHKDTTGEAMVILLNCDKENALKVAEKLAQALNSYICAQGLSAKIKLRLGLATYPEGASSAEELIRNARESRGHKDQAGGGER